ncbi:MAG: UDP-N-acetylmuramoyl-L-alanyl-D-glutamate--2,6-diaminopimelate ligase [Candidatus Limnocylindrales bacterium]|jgi:UDP-N-acetylmuramoyl-L-alanyl-D-glutamate--2,6-diaminopimelate ligase
MSVDAAAQRALAAMLAAAEPQASRRLGELIERLEAEGRLRTVRPPEGAPSDGASSATVRSSAVAVGSIPVRGVAFDSRSVEADGVFVAIPGEHVDGHDYVADAVARGAAATIVERPLSGVAVPQIVVDRGQAALAAAAAWWYGDPSRELGIVGVTGTDGKTTTSFLASAVLEAAGISTGQLTTAQIKIGDLRGANPEHVTTPQAPQLQRALRAMVKAGNKAAIVETTSHGLALERVGGIAYDVAIFTNLTHEHLELHGTFEAYRDAKLGLFRNLGADLSRREKPARRWPRAAIVNHDDPSASLFEAAGTSVGTSLLTYGYSADADVRAVSVEEDSRRLGFGVRTARWSGEVSLQLAGRFNVYNALAAVALGEALELPPQAIRTGLAGVRGVPGRMERVDCGQPFAVIVDYAHSPASLQVVLDQLAPVAAGGDGALIVVFGSAGERDVQKRPLMGRIAGERCRLVVVTDEDPRGEDRQAILDEIAAGAESAGKRRGEDVLCIPDRAEAIAAAFDRAGPGDVVVLAGKGHEQSIIMNDGPRPWDERTEAIRALAHVGYRKEDDD